MTNIAFDRKPVETTESAPIAFVMARTPVERAWADLCDGIENVRVETVIACLGGWERMIDTPITFRDFTAAFYDTEDGALCSAKRRGER